MQGVKQAEQTVPIVAPPGAVCRRCRYGIKGLAVTAACPECNTPIGGSMPPAWGGNSWAPATLVLLRRRMLVVAISEAALLLLSIAMAVSIVNQLGRIFSPTTGTDEVLNVVLPAAMLVAFAVFAAAAVAAIRAIQGGPVRKGGRSLAPVAIAGAFAVAVTWSNTWLQDLLGFGMNTHGIDLFAFSLGGLALLMVWARAQRGVTDAVSGRAVRVVAHIQSILTDVLALVTAVVLLGEMLDASSRHGWLSVFEGLLPFLIGGVHCVLPVNAFMVRQSLRRLLADRSLAA